MREVRRRVVGVGLVALSIGAGAAPPTLSAQEGAAGCDRLNLAAARKELTETGIDFFYGNFAARCGDARMSADSAFVRERLGVLVSARLIRNVRYQDSTRSLTSDSLAYSGADDRVVAMGNVVLTMRKSGALLSGPRVEFHRLTSSGAERTIATERPRLMLEGEPGSGNPPTTIDADEMEIFREDNAWYRGEVVIRRPDAVSYADSAFFDMVNGTGVLFSGARMDGEEFELHGDSIRMVLQEETLESVHAFHGATAAGDGFNIASEQIRVQFTDGEVEQVEAFGSRSAALSEGYHLMADSLRFKFRDGAMDSTFAIGSAVALEDTTADIGSEPSLSVDSDAGWLAGDTIVASFRHLMPPDSAVEAAADSVGVAADSVDVAADSVDVAVTGGTPDSAGVAAAEDADEAPRSELEQLRTVGNARAFYVSADTAVEGRPARNYLIGDEISIFFEQGRPVRVAAAQAIGVYLDPDPDAVALSPEEMPDGAPDPERPAAVGDEDGQPGEGAGDEDAPPAEAEGEEEAPPAEAEGGEDAPPAKPRARLPGDSS